MQAAIATLTAKEGAVDDLLAVGQEMAAAVNANEPGCLSYEVFKGEEANTIVFVERYENEAATEAHRNSDHFKTIGARMGPFMAARPAVLRLSDE
ncbi:MAG: antibiotic biosynthesis monooxygenase [Rhodospirillaceae bacterium]|nr:antibiotic biosynthesis monooxygenase [Rhodospirillaceae bacterium]